MTVQNSVELNFTVSGHVIFLNGRWYIPHTEFIHEVSLCISQWWKSLRAVCTIVTPCSSHAAITPASLVDPAGEAM